MINIKTYRITENLCLCTEVEAKSEKEAHEAYMKVMIDVERALVKVVSIAHSEIEVEQVEE